MGSLVARVNWIFPVYPLAFAVALVVRPWITG